MLGLGSTENGMASKVSWVGPLEGQDSPTRPEQETLLDMAARVVRRQASAIASVANITGEGFTDNPPKETDPPGLTHYLERANEQAAHLDALLAHLAARIGRL